MNKQQQARYDKTCAKIRNHFGSMNSIATRSFIHTDNVITGETVRLWMVERRMPTDFAFVLYEMMDREIDPLTLTPDLARYVEMKAAPKSG